MLIKFKGREVDTKWYTGSVDNQEIQEVRDNYYDSTYEEAITQLKKLLLHDGKKTNKIYGYFFEKIAGDGILWHSKWSINEMLESPEILQSFINRSKSNPKVFTSNSLTANVKTAIRLGGKGIVKKLTNFPYKECVKLLKTYTKTDSKTYIDPSCGWGIRMLASAYLDLNYVGFDVNPLLVDKLNDLGKEIQKIKPDWQFRVLLQGSEIPVAALNNWADIVMTSPPYYDLENYTNVDDKALHIEKVSYDDWVKLFVEPMLKQMSDYIKPNGYVLMNVKDFKDYSLVDSFLNAGIKAGLSFYGYDELKNPIRVSPNQNKFVDNSEKVVVFRKD